MREDEGADASSSADRFEHNDANYGRQVENAFGDDDESGSEDEVVAEFDICLAGSLKD